MRGLWIFALSALLSLPVFAQQAQPWQETVAGQIEALRSGDGETALNLAGAAFRANYTDPERFILEIDLAGYGPIGESRSYSFGTFREVGDTVLQAVELVGTDQQLWEAVYQLRDEPGEGWRVIGVTLRQVPGLGV
jgi:hypothetical protein